MSYDYFYYLNELEDLIAGAKEDEDLPPANIRDLEGVREKIRIASLSYDNEEEKEEGDNEALLESMEDDKRLESIQDPE